MATSIAMHAAVASRAAPTPRRAPARRHAVRASASRDADRAPDDPTSSSPPAPAPAPSRRRALAAAAAAPFLPGVLAAASALSAPPSALAAASPAVTSKVFFDFAVDAEPAGRVVVGVFGDANPIAAARFAALARGVQGLGYRRTQVDAVEYNEDGGVDSPLFVGDAGVRAFVIPGSSTPVTDLPGGPSADKLAPELAKQTLSHEGAGVVSLVVERGAPPPPPKERLVSVNGKFQTVADPPAPGPNGTAFTITVAPGAAEILDRTNVIVGKVLEGQEVVDALAALPTVKDNSASPFFAVAKTIGDKRATVAEQAFGKPFAKVTVSKCGVVEEAKVEAVSDTEAPPA